MILGEISRSASADAGTTLDDILRLNAARHPDAIALIDPPNRETFTDGAPRRLTYAQADRIVSAIAAAAARHRIVCGFDRRDAIRQYVRKHSDAARHHACRHDRGADAAAVAAHRLRCGLVAHRHQGADDLHARRRRRSRRARDAGRGRDFHDPSCLRISVRRCRKASSRSTICSIRRRPMRPSPFTPDRRDNPALHVAAITFDMTADGIVPVARSHAELLAGGLSMLAESRLAPDSHMLSSLARGVLCRHRADARAVASLRRTAQPASAVR